MLCKYSTFRHMYLWTQDLGIRSRHLCTHCMASPTLHIESRHAVCVVAPSPAKIDVYKGKFSMGGHPVGKDRRRASTHYVIRGSVTLNAMMSTLCLRFKVTIANSIDNQSKTSYVFRCKRNVG